MAGGTTAFSVAEIVATLGGEFLGDGSLIIRGVGTLVNARPDQAAFFANGKYRKELASTRAGVVVLSPTDIQVSTGTRIVSGEPYLYFARLSTLLNPPSAVAPGVHPSAVVEADAHLDASACIGPMVRVGHGASIGPRVVIEAGSVIGDHVEIGADTRIYANVVVYHGCLLGERVILHGGVVIGADGFGFAPVEGRWKKIPQVGRVVVGDDVEIGANTTVDRGALDDTVIEEGVKLDNQIQVGHNVHIGAHTAIAGCVAIAGSVRIGKHCRIGGASAIVGHLEIADGVDISGNTTIIKSIREKGTYSGLFPFSTHARWLRNAAALRNLDALVKQVKGLEDRLKSIEGKN
jgi:UDP-3-O-[3-hydroxymyristoyl] glucosamine N-acyltransferase